MNVVQQAQDLTAEEQAITASLSIYESASNAENSISYLTKPGTHIDSANAPFDNDNETASFS